MGVHKGKRGLRRVRGGDGFLMKIKKPPYQLVQIYSPWCSKSKGEERIITLVRGERAQRCLNYNVGIQSVLKFCT